jgi:hypothetical protein
VYLNVHGCSLLYFAHFYIYVTVAYKLHDEQVIVKAKGVANPEYSWDWFDSVINKRANDKQAVRFLYRKKFDSLIVKEQGIQITLKNTLYDKRICILNDKKRMD